MYLGEIVEIGRRDQVFAEPSHPYTRRLLAAAPVPDPTVDRPRLDREARDIPSPIHPIDHVPIRRPLRKVDEGHFVVRA